MYEPKSIMHVWTLLKSGKVATAYWLSWKFSLQKHYSSKQVFFLLLSSLFCFSFWIESVAKTQKWLEKESQRALLLENVEVWSAFEVQSNVCYRPYCRKTT